MSSKIELPAEERSQINELKKQVNSAFLEEIEENAHYNENYDPNIPAEK